MIHLEHLTKQSFPTGAFVAVEKRIGMAKKETGFILVIAINTSLSTMTVWEIIEI